MQTRTTETTARGRGRHLTARGAVRLAAAAAAVTLVLSLAASPAGASRSKELAQAKHKLLVHADFPSGWVAKGKVTTSHGGGKSGFPGAKQLASCLGVPAKVLDLNAPSVSSPTFHDAPGTDFVQDTVSVFSSPKVARREYAALANPKVPGCMTTVLQGPAGRQLLGSLGNGTTVGTITVTAADSSWLVPHSSGFAIAFPVTTHGVTLNSSITVVSMVRGRSGSQITYTSVGPPFPASVARHLNAVASRRT